MKNTLRRIACILVLMLFVSIIPSNVVAATEEESSDIFESFASGTILETAPDIAEMDLKVGAGLIDTYLAAGDTIASRDVQGWIQDESAWSSGLPKGKNSDGTKSWGWWRGSASNTSTSVTGVNTLSLSAYQTDSVILLPTLPSTNYKFEATFTVVGVQTVGEETAITPSGSFGLVTNIGPDYTESIGGTRFGVYTSAHSSGDKNRVFVHNKSAKASIGEELYESAQTNRDNLTGYTAPSAGDSVTLTVYVYEGINYCYVNGIYTFAFASKLTTVGESLCGLYVSGNDTLNVTITSIYVKELIAAPVIPTEISALNLAIGDMMLDTDVSSREIIGSRDANGWVQDSAEWSCGLPKGKNSDGTKSWGWWRGSASNTSTSVIEFNTLSLTSYQTDSVILLPTLPSTNYMLEASFTVVGVQTEVEGTLTTPSGSFGLVTNIGPNYIESIGGTRMGVYTSGHSSGDKNRIFVHNKSAKASIGEELYESSQTNRDNLNGYMSPSAGSTVTLTVYVYEGTNYYYVNGIYVFSFDSKLTTAGESLCGLYSSGNENLTVTISDISVRELLVVGSNTEDNVGDDTQMEEELKGLDFEGYYTLGEVLYQSDFEGETVGELPAGWSKGSKASGTSYGYTSDASTASMTAEVAELEGYGKVVHFNSSQTDAYLATPATGTMDYLFEATVIVNYDTEGEFGLANNFYASVTDADGCMYNSSYIPAVGAEKKVSTWKYRTSNGSAKGDWVVSYYPKKGDIANLKILSYNGYNYMYWNDLLCAIGQARGVTGGLVAVTDSPGFFTWNGDIYITETKVTKIYYDQAELAIDQATLCINESGTVSVDIDLSFDKTQEIYSKYIIGDYVYSDNADMKFGVLMAAGSGQTAQKIAADTAGVVNTVFTQFTQDEGSINFDYSIADILSANYDTFYTIRPYVLVQDAYYYGNAKTYSAAALANGVYAFVDDNDVKETLETVFVDSNVFVGEGGASLTFTLFSDFHYKARMYPTTIADLRSILNRADTSNSAFVMSAGDFCNDAIGSPELFSTYHNYLTQEGELLKAYNIYGNHELESKDNSMEVVTPLLTNDSTVVWGTADGTYNANVGYYYFESNGFRIVCTDNNYSWNPTGQYWEHNRTKSYGAPSGNTNTYSLGPEQLEWLENVLTNAANQDIPCIIVEHSTSSDVKAIYRKVNNTNPGTVLMCISGHTHTDEQELDDGVFHLVCNTTRNGEWIDGGTAHYTAEHTFMYEDYDSEGNLLSTYAMSLGDLSQGSNTWFFTNPLSAVITVNEYGVISVDGCESSWAYNIVPATAGGNCVPRISSGTYWSCDMLGHNWVYEYDTVNHWCDGCENALCNEGMEQSTHTFGEWKVLAEATAETVGMKERECIVCGCTETEEIPMVSEE